MFSANEIIRLLERGFEMVDALTKQVSRVAWALEATVLAGTDEKGVRSPCAACGCRLVLTTDTKCPVCDAVLPELPKEIDYHG